MRKNNAKMRPYEKARKANMASLELISAEEVCAELRISRATLYNLINRKEFPPGIRQGRRMMWPKSDIEVYLAKQLRDRDRRR